MRTTRFIRAALVLVVGGATGINCSDPSGPSTKNNLFSVYGVYSDTTGAPLENVTVAARTFMCVSYPPNSLVCEGKWVTLAQARTDVAGHYSLQWMSNCVDGHPDAQVWCLSLAFPQTESCGNFRLQCTDKPQERNCTIQSR